MLNRRMVKTATATLSEVDIILLLIEPKMESEDYLLFEYLRTISIPKILVLNKMDLIGKGKLIALLANMEASTPAMSACHFSEIIPISAKTGENTERLTDLLFSYLPEGAAYFPEDQVTDQPIRFLAAEIIREKVIEQTKEEIPYVVSVEIEKFHEDDKKGLISIGVVIYVEKDSQKGILIGHKGERLKEIGRAARLELEGLLSAKVFLEVWVKVKKEWRKNDLFLNEMGY